MQPEEVFPSSPSIGQSNPGTIDIDRPVGGAINPLDDRIARVNDVFHHLWIARFRAHPGYGVWLQVGRPLASFNNDASE